MKDRVTYTQVDFVGKGRTKERCGEEADTKAYIAQACDTFGEAVHSREEV
jgi:hypothetical protein